ncbi:MAG: hypothetical protein JWR84_1606 [Caulobacter sp.]|nr:hypothetical protein [Caulobacter sp.]
MTLVVCHYPDDGEDQIQVWADTRISGPVGTLTDHGPKLFQIPISVRSLTKKLSSARALYGFAYAGSSLAAISTHAVALSCLGSLSAKGTARAPSVWDVAGLYQRLLQRFCREIATGADFYVFGFCARSNRYRIIRGFSNVEAGLGLTVSLLEMDLERGRFWAMGSGDQRFAKFVEERRGSVGDKIQAFVATEVDPSVGGYVQSACCDRFGVSLPLVAVPTGPKTMGTSFVGIDTTEIGAVGDLDVGRVAISLGMAPSADDVWELTRHYGRPRRQRRREGAGALNVKRR